MRLALLAFATADWLVAPPSPATEAYVREACWGGLCGLELGNGLVQRRFVLHPAFGTVDWRVGQDGGEESMMRAVEPEGRVVLDGTSYAIGGLGSGGVRAYCNRTGFNASLMANPRALRYVRHTVEKPTAPFPWTPGTRHGLDAAWPPAGTVLAVVFATPGVPVEVTVRYELYSHVPLLAKWVTVVANSEAPGAADVVVNQVDVELFAATPRFSTYAATGSLVPGQDWGGQASSAAPAPLLDAKTDQAHGAACAWQPEPGDAGAVQSVLNCSYTSAPGAHVNARESFVSFKALLLATDSTDLERRSLMRHRVTQLLAPHVTENPIFFHATDVTDAGFKTAVDQMQEVGFEMLIFSFGSGFVLETANASYLAHIKAQVDYAKSKGIEVGGYDLICLDRGHGGYGGNVGDQWARVDPDGSLTVDACFASGWNDKLLGLVDHFLNATGLSMLETDGPYGGGVCASTEHHHHGLEDSVYRQTQAQNAFYHQMRARNVYVNQPDNYFFQGGSKTGMGYNENQFSLPRWEDLSISRMGLYDDMYALLPTQGWMFVPLSVYHGGGQPATFLPDAAAYEWALAQYLGAGTAACYRGPMLYEPGTPQGAAQKEALLKWVGFYKTYRRALIQPVVHVRRANVQSWDGWLHVAPTEQVVGVAVLFNPTDVALNASVPLPVYYAGLEDHALVSVDEAPSVVAPVDRAYVLHVSLVMPARSIHTVVLRRPTDSIFFT